MTEFQIATAAVGVILAALVLVLVVHIVYRGLPPGKAKEGLQKIIYELDRHADDMENHEKRAAAIQAVMDLLGWRRIIVPKVLVGWLIDTEVAAIRKIQQATDTPNLHQDGGNFND
jgi:Co/Zn/Cd efflux system component